MSFQKDLSVMRPYRHAYEAALLFFGHRRYEVIMRNPIVCTSIAKSRRLTIANYICTTTLENSLMAFTKMTIQQIPFQFCLLVYKQQKYMHICLPLKIYKYVSSSTIQKRQNLNVNNRYIVLHIKVLYNNDNEQTLWHSVT